MKTTLKCPNCGKVGQTTHFIRTGSRVRCSQCDRPFLFSPPEGDDDNHQESELETIGDKDIRSLRSVLAEEAESRPPETTVAPIERMRAGKRVPRERFPHAPASESSKEVLIGGKPLRFVGSRKFMAAVGVVALLGVAYIAFWGLHGFLRESESASQRRQRTQQEQVAKLDERPKRAEAKPKAVAPAAAPAAVPERPRVTAGDPVRIGDMEVCVKEAFEGAFDAAQGEVRLAINLKIKNLSQSPITYLSWADPKHGLLLRDTTPTGSRHPLVGPRGADERVIAPGDTYVDLLVFLPTPRLYGLELDLPIPGTVDRFRFEIPTAFIRRIE
jgi:hypothetical protein